MSLKSCEKTGTNEVTIELSISAEAFADANVKAYNKVKKNITVPGFRKGKAPKAFIEKYYGEGVFYDDALEIAFPEAYEAAVEEAGIDPVDNPFDFDIKSVGKDGVELSCKVTVKPEIELGEYKGLKAEKEAVAVTAEEVEAELKKKQDDNARIVDVDDRAVADGDIVTIDYEGFNDGVAFDGGKAEEFDLTIGSGQFIPGFEEKIIGHNIGEEFDIDVTFPEEYHAEDLAGKPVVFKIKLHGIKVRELPELDDEFVKDISEFDTLDELKADIEKNMTEAKQANADRAFESKLLDMVAESVKGEIPECMIEKAIDDMIQDMDYRLRMQGLDFKTYLMYTGMDEKVVREQYKEQAAKDVKLMLAIEKIVATEGLDATEEEINAHYQKFADGYGMAIEEIKKVVSEKTAKNDITSRKAIDLIVDSAKATKPRKTAAKKTTTKKTTKKTEEAAEEAPAEETAE
ncbi:MAG: trigger factor [Clostridia bacterium]|nr:trigger factor [Clostridia bacterium]